MKFPSLRLRFPRFPVAVEFTREGLIFVLLSLAIGAAAVNTGNNVLYFIFSVMLGLIVVSGIISRRILKGVNAVIEFPDQLYAGVPNVCYVSVANRKRRIPALGVRFAVRDPLFAAVNLSFFFIPPGEELHAFAPVTFSRRGLFQLREMELQTRFPFSFFVKIRRFFVEKTIKVYPRIYRFSEDLISKLSHGIMIESPYRGESQQLLHLREYNPLDSSKRIHWKASAKAEKLLVKEFQKEQGRDLHVYFDCYPSGHSDPERYRFEKAISLAGSLALLFSSRGIRGKMIFGNRSFEIHQNFSMPALLEFLAVMENQGTPVAAQDVPSDPDTVVLCVRSREIAPSRQLDLPQVRSVFVEDWLPLMKDAS